MRKYLTLTAISLGILLSGCTRTTDLRYDISFARPLEGAVPQTSLIESLQDVLEGKLGAAQVPSATVATIPEGDTGYVSIRNVPSSEAERVQALLEMPFTFDVRVRKVETTGDDPNAVENWEKTAFTGSSLQWVNVVQDRTTNEAGVELLLTNEGREKLTKIFTDHPNRDIGVFVRDRLVSSLQVSSPNIGERVVIGGIPSIDIAKIFANDVNVGLYIDLIPSS